jgi:hypothetical protein
MFYGNGTQVLILPETNVAVRDLTLSFFHRTNSSAPVFTVGYYAAGDPAFKPLKVLYLLSTYGDSPTSVDLSEASADAQYIAIQYSGASSTYSSAYIDNAKVLKTSDIPAGIEDVQNDKVQCTTADLLILPLKMESESANPSLLEKLQTAEYAAIQELTMRTAKRGHAVMCSGANLIVRREAWLACEPDLHPEIPSGDDMFLLEAMKKRGYKISVIDEPDYTAVVRPQTTWRAFFRQRMRWAGKAPKYTDPDILRCGALIVAANLLQLLCPLILLIKFPIEYSLIRRRQMREHKIINYQLSIINFSIALLLEFLYPFYILLSLLGGLFRQKKW